MILVNTGGDTAYILYSKMDTNNKNNDNQITYLFINFIRVLYFKTSYAPQLTFSNNYTIVAPLSHNFYISDH